MLVREEGNVGKVYLDPVGIPTVCVGHTSTVTRADVGKTYSAELCEKLLLSDTRVAQAAVGRTVQVPLTQGQYDSLVSFTFNVGSRNFEKSTLLRYLNAGDCHAAAAQFDRWHFAKGRSLPGLIKRRAHERATFERDCP